MDKQKIALIGCGRVAGCHLKAVTDNADRAELVAVCDLDTAKAKRLLDAYHIYNVKVYADYTEMIAAEHPDICSVATYSGTHADITEYCLTHGADVLCEKPLALSIADADRVIDTAKRCGRHLGVCFQNRFNKAVTTTLDAIHNDRLGDLIYGTIQVRWSRSDEYYAADSWRGTWALDGGSFMNQSIHGIDLLLYTMGSKPVEVVARVDNLCHSNIEAEDFGLCIVKFENGTYGLIEGTTDVYRDNLEETLTLFGRRGTVKASGECVNTIEVWNLADRLDDEEKIKAECIEHPGNVYGFGHSPLYKNFLDHTLCGAPLIADAACGKAAVEVILAAYLSSKTGLPVKLPLENCSTLDFKG